MQTALADENGEIDIKHISMLSFSKHIVAWELSGVFALENGIVGAKLSVVPNFISIEPSDLVEHHWRWVFKPWIFSILVSVARWLP